MNWIITDHKDVIVNIITGYTFEIKHIQVDEFWVIFRSADKREYIIGIYPTIDGAQNTMLEIAERTQAWKPGDIHVVIK